MTAEVILVLAFMVNLAWTIFNSLIMLRLERRRRALLDAETGLTSLARAVGYELGKAMAGKRGAEEEVRRGAERPETTH